MKKILIIFLIISANSLFAQKKYAADQHFQKFAYLKAAKLYEKIYDGGDDSKLVLSRLGDAYYYNTSTELAEKWYAKFLEVYTENDVEPEYIFRYAQVLKSNGKEQESDIWMEKFRKVAQTDSRGKDDLDILNYLDGYVSSPDEFVTIHNLSINSKYSDFGAFASGNEVIFASTRPIGKLSKSAKYGWNKQPFLDLYLGEEMTFGNENDFMLVDVKDYNRMNSKINSPYHEANGVKTKDGRVLYFTRDNMDGRKLGKDRKNTTHLKLYKAFLKNNKWTDVEELSFNSDEYSIGHPALSADESALYFVSDMPGGFGYTDIYKVDISENGEYGKPINLGEAINTKGREMFPFLSQDNMFYFSSDGHPGFGALDIFSSQVKEKGYSNVQNVGDPLNSELDDFAFFIREEGKRGYFSSNRKGGKGDDDIYSFAVNPCQKTIDGYVINSITKERMVDVNIRLLDADGKQLSKIKSDSLGTFAFTKVECNSKSIVVADIEDYKGDFEEVILNIDDDGETVTLEITPLIQENQIVIAPIYFDFDKYDIRGDAAAELENVVAVLENHPEMVIKIESHTDSRGNDQYNEKLSDRRAKSTRDYIISRGIAANRIESAIGYGEYQLLNNCDNANSKNCSEAEHQLNRRSYFYILGNKNSAFVSGGH